jgi:uncharacterized membrane protein YbhN (UPF0104 family)
MRRSTLALLAQVAISGVLLLLLARRVPLEAMGTALSRVRPTTLMYALALSLAGYWGRAQRWSVLLARSGVVLSAGRSYWLTLVGTFYGVVTPGRVGEFARIAHLRTPHSQALPSVIWDRVADVLLLEFMCVPAFLVVPAWRGPLLAAYLAMVAATVAGVVLLASPAAARGAARRLPLLAGAAARWGEASSAMLSSRVFASSLAWGVFFYAFVYTAAGLLLRDLAPAVSPQLLLGLPVIPLLGNLPIAFGGLGLREQVSAAVFTRFGADAATGAAFSLLWFATATLGPGLLGLVFSATPWARRSTAGEGA